MSVSTERSVEDLLAALDAAPSAVAYLRAARELPGLAGDLDPVGVSLLASFTIDPLVPYLAVEAARRGFGIRPRVGPFNGAMRELIDPASGTLEHQPDVVFIAQLLEDVSPALAYDYLALDANGVEAEIARVLAELRAAITEFRGRSNAFLVVHSFMAASDVSSGLGQRVTRDSQAHVIRELNARLGELAATLPDVHVLDHERVVAETGVHAWWDEKMWFLGRAPLSARALPTLAGRYAAFVQAVRRPPRKCLVLDLDDTLWGGVLGEVGMNGIKLGADYPGNVFRDFQRSIRTLKQQGTLLAINSKNNFDEVRDAFASHTGMVLRFEDFSAVRINWQSKPQNMTEIAHELSIGVDSLVFVDDNPAERALMRQALPQVLTPELPADPLKFWKVLQQTGVFDRLSITNDDRRRAEMYREQGQRRQAKETALSVDQFLASLDMQVAIQPVTDATLSRVADLIQKTNQFNLTTRRRSAAEIAGMLTDPSYGVLTARVVDRFGDNGIVGVAIVQARGGRADIDTLLLSCRVIGRTIETALVVSIARWARSRDLASIRGEFIPTAKNAPARDFFGSHGFRQVVTEATGSTWEADAESARFVWPPYIRELT